MTQKREKSKKVLLREDGLQAGQLYSSQGGSSRYVGFKTDERGVVWVRECTHKEKRWLKQLCSNKKIESLETTSNDGRTVSLFSYK